MSLSKIVRVSPRIIFRSCFVGVSSCFRHRSNVKALLMASNAHGNLVKMMSQDSSTSGSLNGLVDVQKPTTTITIEGNIGAGKTTLMDFFSQCDNVTTVVEPVAKWQDARGHNLFDLMYRDPQRWSFAFQSYVQLTMLENHRIKVPTPFKMMERSVYGARYCFVENLHLSGTMSDPEFTVLDELFQWVIANHDNRVDRILYLRTPPEECYKRIRQRCRTEEEGIPLEYLQKLHQRYEDWLVHGKYPVPGKVMILDGSPSLEEMLKTYQTKKDTILCRG